MPTPLTNPDHNPNPDPGSNPGSGPHPGPKHGDTRASSASSGGAGGGGGGEPNRVRLAPGVEVHAGVLRFSTSRSGGPGGQNVNKVETKVELRVRFADLPMERDAKQRLAALSGRRVVGDVECVEVERPPGPDPDVGPIGPPDPAPTVRTVEVDHRELVISADEHRSQRRNREATIDRLCELVRQALVRPKVRKKTKPSKASQRRRVDDKRARGEIKRRRQSPDQ